MKISRILLLCIFTLVSFHQFAQEAKLIQKDEWGSREYEHSVLIDDIYYIASKSNTIDLIDSRKSGEEAFLKQITLDESGYISKIGVFKERLLLSTSNKVSFYSITDDNELELDASFIISPSNKYSVSFVVEQEKLYFSDSRNKIYEISEVDNSLKVTNVIEAGDKDIPDSMSSSQSYLAVEGTDLFYLYKYSQFGDDPEIPMIEGEILRFEKFDLASKQRLALGTKSDDWNINSASYVGNGRFVVSANSSLNMIEVSLDKITVVNDFLNEKFPITYKLAYHNNKLYAVSNSTGIRTFSVQGDSVVEDSFFSLNGYGYVTDLKYNGNKLTILTINDGLIEFTISNNNVESVKKFYNQSGLMNKGLVQGDKVYLPRNTRLDILDISQTSNILLLGSLDEEVSAVFSNGDNYLFNHYDSLSINEKEGELDFKELSRIFTYHNHSFLTKTETRFFSYWNDSIIRYDTSSPYALYKAPDEISILNTTYSPSCLEASGYINEYLSFFDFCDNKLHLLENYEGDPLTHYKSVNTEEVISNSVHSVVLIENNRIYALYSGGINIYSVSEDSSLIEVPEYEFIFEGRVLNATIADDYLVVATSSYLYLFSLVQSDNPVLISQTSNFSGYNIPELKLKDNLLHVFGNKYKLYELNKAPRVISSQIITNEDTEFSSNVIFSDPESDEIIFSLIQEPTRGVLTISNEYIVYKPNENFYGNDSLIIRAEDSNGNFIEQEITVLVNAVNDAPIITTSLISTDEDQSVEFQIQASDVENDSLVFTLAKEAEHGLFMISDTGLVSYTPNENYFGTDFVTIKVEDSVGLFSEKVIEITVNPINDIPSISSLVFSHEEDTELVAQITGIDIDSDDLTFTLLHNEPIEGSISLSSEGLLNFIPNKDYYGELIIIIKVNDDNGGSSEAAIVITTTPVNDRPIILSSSFTSDEDTIASFQVEANDIDDELLDFSLIDSSSSGMVSISNTGLITYSPNADFFGTDFIKIRVQDPDELFDEKVIEITVNPINDSPILSSLAFTHEEDQKLVAQLTAIDSDSDDISFELLESNNVNGELSLTTKGLLNFSPNEHFNGSTTVGVAIKDSEGGINHGNVEITTTPVNDMPEVTDISIVSEYQTEKSGMLLANDIDGDELVFSIIDKPANGSLSLSADGSYVYKPDLKYSGTDVFSFEVSDGQLSNSAKVKITVQSKPKDGSGGSINFLWIIILIVIGGLRLDIKTK